MIRAAGILYRTKDGQVLFVQRAGDGDYPAAWAFPGGKLEEAETPEEAACREAAEECGEVPDGKRAVLARTVTPAGPTSVDVPGSELSAPVVPSESVDFTTFLQDVPEPFDVTLCDENTAFTWAPYDQPPEPLHPGARVALDCLSANELGIARMMAAGTLTSPQYYGNVALFDIRITGTGVAYRKALDEFCYRAPENYLTPEFLARCNGLPVLWEHPAKATLDSKEWSDRVVGSTFLPYIKGDEVWGIVKIYDSGAIEEMAKGGLSTSPTVSFGAGVVLKDASTNDELLEDGSLLLIEGDPPLLDHIAICEKGVWDKGGDPAGVNTAKADSMDEKEMADAIAKADAARKDAEAKVAKADADKADADGRVAKLMDSLADMTKRMDAWDEEKKSDKAKKDAEKEATEANEAANEPGAGDPKEVERKAKDGQGQEGRREGREGKGRQGQEGRRRRRTRRRRPTRPRPTPRPPTIVVASPILSASSPRRRCRTLTMRCSRAPKPRPTRSTPPPVRTPRVPRRARARSAIVVASPTS